MATESNPEGMGAFDELKGLLADMNPEPSTVETLLVEVRNSLDLAKTFRAMAKEAELEDKLSQAGKKAREQTVAKQKVMPAQMQFAIGLVAALDEQGFSKDRRSSFETVLERYIVAHWLEKYHDYKVQGEI